MVTVRGVGRAVIVGSLWLIAGNGGLYAQGYPNRPVTIVVPFVAGGGVDVVARIIGARLGDQFGQIVVIENRGGAGGTIGAASVAQSLPDGYTLLPGTDSAHGANSNVYAKLSYDPARDSIPIVQLTSSTLILAARTSLPVHSVSELIAHARFRSGELSFGSYGAGSINHLRPDLFNSMAKIQANHIPCRGSAPVITDLIGGRLDCAFDNVSRMQGYEAPAKIEFEGVSGPQAVLAARVQAEMQKWTSIVPQRNIRVD